MAETSISLVSSANLQKLSFQLPTTTFAPQLLKVESLSRKHHQSTSQVGRRGSSRHHGRLITISPSEGRWEGEWSTQYKLSLRDLQLQDLIHDHDARSEYAGVTVTLSVQRHASFGLSIEGRILGSFSSRCTHCSSLYCRKIDKNFTVWVLSSIRDNRETGLPEIGGDDPSVIYVKPGDEASLDSLIQDTIRLNASIKDTCSESCERSHSCFTVDIGRKSSASVYKRWYKLLELRKTQNP